MKKQLSLVRLSLYASIILCFSISCNKFITGEKDQVEAFEIAFIEQKISNNIPVYYSDSLIYTSSSLGDNHSQLLVLSKRNGGNFKASYYDSFPLERCISLGELNILNSIEVEYLDLNCSFPLDILVKTSGNRSCNYVYLISSGDVVKVDSCALSPIVGEVKGMPGMFFSKASIGCSGLSVKSELINFKSNNRQVLSSLEILGCENPSLLHLNVDSDTVMYVTDIEVVDSVFNDIGNYWKRYLIETDY